MGIFSAMARRFLARRRWILARLPVELGEEDPRIVRLLYNFAGDFFRASTLYMMAKEIDKGGTQGSIAEVGVYLGDFARLMNHLFPTRTLYLFDTFEGFDLEEYSRDERAGLALRWQSFETSVEQVMRKMPRPERVIVKKGRFPATAQDLEDVFALVSLDVDLYAPTLAGLEYFYPRLAEGGYLLVHDFNQPEYRGCRKAVLEFCAANAGVSRVPLGDWGGTAVLCRARAPG